MISLNHLLLMLLNHFLADFGLQTHEQATMKSEDTPEGQKQLLYHVLTYTGVMFITGWILLGFIGGLFFGAITGVCHYFTDHFTSRLSKKYFKAEVPDWHNGFVVIGADQLSHYVQLFATYSLIHWIQNWF